jgi:hypothetical protein
MSTSTISFWQADRNWYIQQRIWTLSASTEIDPNAPAAPTNKSPELKSAEISGLQLSSSSRSGYTSSIATGGSLLNLSA